MIQKGSPYLEDTNHILELALQMGLIQSLYDKTISNAAGSNFTRCRTWHDIEASHGANNPNIILEFEEIRGMLLTLAIGLCASLFIFMGEILTPVIQRSGMSPLLRDQELPPDQKWKSTGFRRSKGGPIQAMTPVEP